MAKQWVFDQQKIAKQAQTAWARLDRAIHFRHHKEYHLYGARGLKFKNWSREQFESWFHYHVITNKIVDPAVTVIRPFDHIQPDNVFLDTRGIVVAFKQRVEREVEEGRRKPEIRGGDIQLEFIQIPRSKTKVDNVIRAKTAWRNIRAKCTKSHNKWFRQFGAKGVELKVDQKSFVDWFVHEQSRLDLSKPAVVRKNDRGNFEVGNLRLLEMSDLMAKEGKIIPAIPIALIPQIGKPLWCRSIADAARYLGVHPTTVRAAMNSKKLVKGLFRVSVDADSSADAKQRMWSSAA
jgi:hypothetical protein